MPPDDALTVPDDDTPSEVEVVGTEDEEPAWEELLSIPEEEDVLELDEGASELLEEVSDEDDGRVLEGFPPVEDEPSDDNEVDVSPVDDESGVNDVDGWWLLLTPASRSGAMPAMQVPTLQTIPSGQSRSRLHACWHVPLTQLNPSAQSPLFLQRKVRSRQPVHSQMTTNVFNGSW